MTRRFALLVNPHSGAGAAVQSAVEVAKLLREAGADVSVTYSSGPLAVVDLAAEAVGAGRVVVAVGGDGMVSSLAGPMAAAMAGGGMLGFVPSGRGNDFARMLGVPSGASEIAARLLDAEPRLVDVIDVEEHGVRHVVAGSVYAGADAHAAAMVARMRRTPKPLQYPWAALRAIASYVPHRYRLSVDGEVSEFEAATVVVANSAFYGAGMKVAPAAVVDDGVLDVVVVGAGSRFELATAFPKIYDGSHVTHPKVTVLRGREIELSALSIPPVALGGDGEDLQMLPGPGAQPLKISVRHRALQVV